MLQRNNLNKCACIANLPIQHDARSIHIANIHVNNPGNEEGGGERREEGEGKNGALVRVNMEKR